MDRLIAEIKVNKDDLREVAKEVFEHNFDGMSNGQVVMQALLPLFPNLKAETIYEASFGRHIKLTNGKWVVNVPIEWWEEHFNRSNGKGLN